MLDNTQSIICAVGLAAAAPRSPYRHLELCGIALYFFASLSGKMILLTKKKIYETDTAIVSSPCGLNGVCK
ncbi:MAG: hypothetical protein MR715_01090 [Subdoligranulum sp.]|nr:hypothetical protein [Subdoligranulum sp.]